MYKFKNNFCLILQPKKSTPKKPANPNISKQMEKVQITPKSKQGKSTPAKNLLVSFVLMKFVNS